MGKVEPSFRRPRHLPPDADDVRLAGADVMADVLVVAAVVGLGHEHVHVLPDHLGGRVAENPLRRRIEGLDDRPLVDRDDPVDDVFEHGADAVFRLGQFLQPFRRRPARGAVFLDAHRLDPRRVRSRQRAPPESGDLRLAGLDYARPTATAG